MIKLVTFDLDDTLWSVTPVVHRANQLLWQWLEREAPRYVEHFSLSDLAEGSALRRSLLERFPEIAHSMTEIRIRLIEEGMRQVGYSEAEAASLAAASFDHFHQHRHAVTPYEEVIEMLSKLKSRGYLVGALSNGNADIQRTPLAPWFDFQYNADSVGTAKPHPLMFEKALQHAGVTPAETVHIGDHPINDIRAARDLGIHTLWVNPEGHQYLDEVEADLSLQSIAEIPAAIARLEQASRERASADH